MQYQCVCVFKSFRSPSGWWDDFQDDSQACVTPGLRTSVTCTHTNPHTHTPTQTAALSAAPTGTAGLNIPLLLPRQPPCQQHSLAL